MPHHIQLQGFLDFFFLVKELQGTGLTLERFCLSEPSSRPRTTMSFYLALALPYVLLAPPVPNLIINHDIRQAFAPHYILNLREKGTPNLCPRHDTPSTDDVVSVTSEQSLAISRPGQGNTLGLSALLANSGELGLELIDLGLLLEVEDDDAAGGSSAEPVSVGGEDESVDLVVGVEGVQVLGLVEIPEHGGAVLAAGSAERTVGGDGDGVDVASVTDVVGLQLAAGQLPDLMRWKERPKLLVILK